MRQEAREQAHTPFSNLTGQFAANGTGFRYRSTVSTEPTVLLLYCSLTDVRSSNTISIDGYIEKTDEKIPKKTL